MACDPRNLAHSSNKQKDFSAKSLINFLKNTIILRRRLLSSALLEFLIFTIWSILFFPGFTKCQLT